MSRRPTFPKLLKAELTLLMVAKIQTKSVGLTFRKAKGSILSTSREVVDDTAKLTDQQHIIVGIDAV